MKGSRIVYMYAVALAVGVFLQFDKVRTWMDSCYEQSPPQAVALALEAGSVIHRGVGLESLGRALDCASAPLFDGAYRNTYRCEDINLADAAMPSAHAQEPEAAPRQERAASPAPLASPASLGAPAPPVAQITQVPPALASVDPASPAAAAPKAPVVLAARKPLPRRNLPANVLVVGDSLAVALSASMERAFKQFDGLNLVGKGKVASGLQNPGYYNWEQALRQYLAEYNPGLVVVMMGANDAKYLSLDPQAEGPVAVQDKRRQTYEARLARFLAVLEEKRVSCCWVGLPVMGDQELSDKSRALNDLIRAACEQSPRARYLDTWPLLSGSEGGYAQHLQDAAGHRVKVREGDRIHFSPAGGDIIVRAFLRGLDDVLELKPRPLREVAAAPAGNPPLQ